MSGFYILGRPRSWWPVLNSNIKKKKVLYYNIINKEIREIKQGGPIINFIPTWSESRVSKLSK